MASNSETGHAKNVANFETLISFCTSYPTYNPSRANLQIAQLNALHTTANQNIGHVVNTNTAVLNATNTRQALFAPIKKLATRIVNALASTDASDETIKDAQTINRKIQGARNGSTAGTGTVASEQAPAPAPDDAAAQNISVSQQSYDSLVQHFSRLIALVSSEPSYTPNEVELQVATLTTIETTLRASNTAVINANTSLSNDRIIRNETLYNPNTGLVAIAADVKKYVKSIFGATSPQYKQVSGIKFTKPRS